MNIDFTTGDKVYFLDEYRLTHGTVISAGPVNLHIEVPVLESDSTWGSYVVRKPRTKCAWPFERVAIVHELWKGRNGRGGYRIEREAYADDRIPAKDWMIERKFEPVMEETECLTQNLSQ